MPRVPSLRRQISPAPIPDVRRSQVPIGQVPTNQIRYSPQASAAQLGDTLTRLGGQVLSGALARERELAEREREKQNRVVNLSTDRQIQDGILEIIYHPERGALTRKGRDAFGLRDTVAEALDKRADDIRKGLSNDEQRMWFEERYASRRESALRAVDIHSAGEFQAYGQAELTKNVENSINLAVHSAATGNLTQIPDERENIRQRVLDWAKNNGVDPNSIEAELTRNMTLLHSGVMGSLLSRGQDREARAYLEQYKGEISGAVLAKIQDSLKENNTLGDSIRASDQIQKQYPFGADGVTQQTWMDEAAKIANPEVRARAEERLRTLYGFARQDAADRQAALVDQAQKRAEELLVNAENRLDAGASIDQLQREPFWAQLPDNRRKDLISYAKLIAKGTEELKTDWGVFTSVMNLLNNPASQQEFVKSHNPMEYRGKLADAEYSKLLTAYHAVLEKKPEKAKVLDDWRTMTQVVNNTLGPLGIGTGTKEDAEAYNEVTRQLSERQTALQKQLGRDATNKELQEELDKLLINLVTVDGWIWDTEKRAFQITPADIPREMLPQIDELLKKNNFAVTPENRRRLYIEKLRAEQAK